MRNGWVMAGLRGDYSNEHGFFVTPRAHLKYNPNDYVNFRLSAGKGYRTIMCWRKTTTCFPAVVRWK